MAFVKWTLRERPPTDLVGVLDLVRRELLRSLFAIRREVNRMGGNVRSVTETDTVLQTDRKVYVDATGGDVVITLPPAADVNDFAFLIMKTDATTNTVTIVGQTGETINGADSKVLYAQFQAIEPLSDGANYAVVYDSNPGRIGTTVRVSIDTTVTPEMQCILVDATGAEVVITLREAAAAAEVGSQFLLIKKVDSSGNAVTPTAAAGDLIDGATTSPLTAQYESVELWPRTGVYDIK